VTPTRLILINVLIRAAAAAEGQLFAFVLADRMGDRAGAGALLVGLIAAAFYATELVGAPIAGRIADERGQLRVLRWGPAFGVMSAVAGVAAATGDLRVAPLVALLLVARATEGASAACAVPTTLGLLARSSIGDAARRLRMMGVFEIASLLGMVLGYGLAGIGWDTLGVRTFLAVAALYGGAWVLAHGRESAVRRGITRAAPVWRTIRSLAMQPGAIPFGIAWLAVNAVVGVWIQQAPYLMSSLYVRHRRHLWAAIAAPRSGRYSLAGE
jgi:MFS family permease